MKKTLLAMFAGFSSLAATAQWNTDVMVNLEVSGLEVMDMKAIAREDGKTWIAYYTPTEGSVAMHAQLLDIDGTKLLGDDGVTVDNKPAGTATFAFNIAVDNMGNLIVGTQDQRDGASAQKTVAYKISQDGTSLWNGEDGVVLGEGYSPNMTVLSNGEIAFAWLGNNAKLAMQKYSADGTAIWAATRTVYNSSWPRTTRGQLVPTSDSGFVLVYQGYNFGINSRLYAQRYDNSGDSVWTSAVQLSDEATSASRYYDVRNEGDTTYIGYYTSNVSSHFNSWLQRINPDGTLPYGLNGAAFSNYSTTANSNETFTSIAFKPGSPYVWAACTYDSAASPMRLIGVYVQKFDKITGAVQFAANGKELYPIDTNRRSIVGSMWMKNDYPVFMVASDRNYVIKGTVIDMDGNFLLPEEDITLSGTEVTTPGMNKSRIGLTENINSQSVAIWSENRDGENRAYAQNFLLSMLDTSIAVSTVGDVPAIINTNAGTLNMMATVLPATASPDVTWAIVPVTGDATISTTGVVTAVSDGTVWAKATSVAAPAYSDSLLITISNQLVDDIATVEREIGFNAYPSPVSDVLTVAIEASHPALQLTITDIKGSIVFSEKVQANALNTPAKIDLGHVAPGVYILKVTSDNFTINRKFVKK